MKNATDKQINFINVLAGQRDTSVLSDLDEATLQAVYNGEVVGISEASALINSLLAAPKHAEHVDLEPGIYVVGTKVYRVKRSQTQHLYAQVLKDINGQRLTEADDVAHVEYEYAPGAISGISLTDRLDPQAATSFSIKYGLCLWCGRHLKDAHSVARGIGPVCAGRLGVK